MNIPKASCILIVCSIIMCTCLFNSSSIDFTLINSKAEYAIYNENSPDKKVIEESKYHKIIKYNNLYYYEISDEDGCIVKSEGSFNRQPKITFVNEYLLKVTIQAGTGLSTSWGYYYNFKTDVFSKVFYGIYDEYNEKVAYRATDGIIIRNIFDENKFYKEISSFKYPLSITTEPFLSISFVNNGHSIEITYLTGDDFKKTTEQFDVI